MFIIKDIHGQPVEQDYLQQLSVLVGDAARAVEMCSEDELEQYANATPTTKMTADQHEAKSKSLTRRIARQRTAKKAAKSLAEKLIFDRQIKALQEELRQHRPNYFELIAN